MRGPAHTFYGSRLSKGYYRNDALIQKLLRFCVLLALCCAPLRAVETVQVAMSDGTKLVTDVHLPEGAGPWPVLLMRSTYGRGVGGPDEVKMGYAVVVQDVRGMGGSEGEKHVFYADGWRERLTDGADTVAWIRAQPWCNGKVGTQGGSALGITQMLLAPAAQGLNAQFIEAGCSNFYADAAYKGGVWQKNLVEGWLAAIQQPHIIEVFKAHPYYDEYWAGFNTLPQTPHITAPALFVGAWQDIFCQGTINAFTERERNGGAGARGNNMLIMKWGVHGPDTSKDYAFNENRFDLKVSQIRNAFFRYWLKGEADALQGIAKVHYYVLGADTPGAPGNEWRTAEHWPPFATQQLHLYLQADRSLASTTPSGEANSLSFTFDPSNPVPTLGGANLLLPSGPYDQREVSGRPDVLAFRSAPLTAPLEITGQVRVQLSVSTTAPDTDFTAKLVDIYPAGDEREILMLDGIQRLKLRNGSKAPASLLTGEEEIIPLEISLESIAWIFAEGHRVGLHISSSNFPRFEVNPNMGADFPGKELQSATNTLHLDAAHASYLLLPVHAQD